MKNHKDDGLAEAGIAALVYIILVGISLFLGDTISPELGIVTIVFSTALLFVFCWAYGEIEKYKEYAEKARENFHKEFEK